MQIIDSNNNKIECHFQILDDSYIDQMVTLEKEIIDGIQNKNLYSNSSKEQFIEIYKKYNAKFLGVLNDNNQLIAMGVYVKFNQYKENYGYDLDILADKLNKCANIESTVVKQEYRGNGIQKLICNELEKIALSDQIEILGATVAPENEHSLKNFLSLGYSIYTEKIKYENFNRYIIYKKIINQ